MKYIKKYGYSFYLGGSLGVFGLDITTAAFYVIMIPTVLLVEFKGDKNDN